MKQFPPESLVDECVSIPSDGSVGGELARLADTLQCERDDKAAIRTWMDLPADRGEVDAEVGVEAVPRELVRP